MVIISFVIDRETNMTLQSSLLRLQDLMQLEDDRLEIYGVL